MNRVSFLSQMRGYVVAQHPDWLALEPEEALLLNLRHLRYFIAVAEELHFARAAEKLHIEQSPLSRAIKELESDLGVLLFERTTRTTRLTHAGNVFLEQVPRVFAALAQARDGVKAAAAGYHGQLRIALSESISQARLSALLAQCREEEPEVDIRLFEVSFAQQVKGLSDDLYDAGFSRSADVSDGLIAVPVWSDPMVVAIPARHPLLAHRRLPLEEVLRYPLVLCDPDTCEGCSRQLASVLRAVDREPIVAEYVTSHELMITLVAAGFGLGFATEAHVSACNHPDIVTRPLAGRSPMFTTFLLRRNTDSPEQLRRFIERINPAELGGSLSSA